MNGRRTPRVLFISGSIGLGHAARDLAIASELRKIRSDAEIVWLAADPARMMISGVGETLLPEGGRAHRGHRRGRARGERVRPQHPPLPGAGAQVMEARRRDVRAGDRETSVRRARRRRDVRDRHRIAPSPRAQAHAVHDHLRLRRARRDDPQPRRAAHGALLEPCLVRWTPRQGAGRRPGDLRRRARGRPGSAVRARAAQPARVRPPLLRVRRLHPRLRPAAYDDRAALRASLGYDERPLIVCAVGGTSVGAELLGLCTKAFPLIRERIPESRMVLVCGPRLDPSAIPAPPGVEVRGFVPRLHEHLAVSDLAIVQGGGTTTLELTALRRPFVYLPLEGHCEQELTVPARLARHGAGEQLRLSETTPQALAAAAARLVGSTAHWSAIPTDGATRAAKLIARQLP